MYLSRSIDLVFQHKALWFSEHKNERAEQINESSNANPRQKENNRRWDGRHSPYGTTTV